jgi:hypothetical protein
MQKIAVLAVVAALIGGPAARAQEAPPKPGPEFKILQAQVGTWETTLKSGGQEFKGTMTYKMELGGLWLVGSLESDLGGQKFFGKGLDTYDAKKKKYVGYWFDSMGTTALMMEGSFDKAKKTVTMSGEGPGPDGKTTTWRSVSRFPNNDTIEQSMYVGNGADPMFTVTYRRKK